MKMDIYRRVVKAINRSCCANVLVGPAKLPQSKTGYREDKVGYLQAFLESWSLTSKQRYYRSTTRLTNLKVKSRNKSEDSSATYLGWSADNMARRHRGQRAEGVELGLEKATWERFI